ncbi:apolipoprotein N-acyltransferase [Paracoccus fistulariae]|uniref:Apolipoprotein N-acyltransferase n=1 Tax=Paracoccus fistulariae TaxID=658446 RepID=A0ABY7SFM1_9RHOB|nr:apolipoprotein N-acyltransferase [Paracoccus fistulariae]MDB6181895.1 apolipoprotein N-acyltransferase [Paracoccus fistulariae]WCR05820.1 apolipoprotein N-acyltransferase [Paracoccus fistulariae]
MRDLTALPHHPRRRPGLRQVLPDLALGLIAALGLAPFNVWGATVLALGALTWRLSRRQPHAVFWHALAAGTGWFALSMSWIVEPFLVEPEIYGWMAPFALLLMALGGALFWAIPIWLAARLSPTWRGRAVNIAAALVLSDWLRGWIFTGLPWAQIGQVWIGTPIAQSAAWIGAIGLSLLTAAIALLPTLFWRPLGKTLYGFLPGTVAAIALTGGLWALGLARLAQPLPPDRDSIIRIVQPDAEQHLKWDPEWSGIFFRRLLDLSAEPRRRDLVIWPETAVNFLLEDAGDLLPIMSQAADAPLVMGIQRRDGSRYFNSIAWLNRDASLGPIYDKFHLVPFGEYIPWGDAMAKIGISAFAAQQGNGYSPGPGPETLPGDEIIPDFQPLICYEAIFSQHLRATENRPSWLLQATNDAWFGTFSGPYQHLEQAQLRAIESGLPLLRAANTGISAVIDPYGDIRASLGMGEIGKIDAALPAALPETFWIRWGNAPTLILLALIFGTTMIRRRA